MKCFDWETRSSEHLDGLLLGPQKKEADEHLESCSKCMGRSQHFREILLQIRNLERAKLPVRLKSDAIESARETLPLSSRIAFLQIRWQRLPWLVKSIAQMAVASALIILSVGIIPEIRFQYEKKTQKKIAANDLEALAIDFKEKKQDAPAPIVHSHSDAQSDSNNDGFEGEYGSEEEENDSEAPSTLKAGKTEIWRFILRSESPREYRSKVIELFKANQLPADTSPFQGVEVPGGIQFDFLVDREKIGAIKDGLLNLSKSVSESIGLPAGIDAFTWYKNRSKKPLPEGKTRVILWLSQI